MWFKSISFIFILSRVLGCVNGGLVPGSWYVISTFKVTVCLSDAEFQGHRLEECLERMTRLVIDPENTYHKDYSRKTGRLPWGRNILNETGLLTYISEEYPLEVVEQAIRLFLNRELESKARDTRKTLLAQERVL